MAGARTGSAAAGSHRVRRDFTQPRAATSRSTRSTTRSPASSSCGGAVAACRTPADRPDELVGGGRRTRTATRSGSSRASLATADRRVELLPLVTRDEPPPRRTFFSAQLPGPMRRFLGTEAGGAALALAGVLVAVGWANSPWADAYRSALDTRVALSVGGTAWGMSVHHWVNDGLMTLFFFVVGLEVRRELRSASSPTAGASWCPWWPRCAGPRCPRCCSSPSSVAGPPGTGGAPWSARTPRSCWGRSPWSARASTQLRLFLLTMSVVDDILAVSVIGVAYTGRVDLRRSRSRWRAWRSWARSPARGCGRGLRTSGADRVVGGHRDVRAAPVDRGHARRPPGAGGRTPPGRRRGRRTPGPGLPAVPDGQRGPVRAARAGAGGPRERPAPGAAAPVDRVPGGAGVRARERRGRATRRCTGRRTPLPGHLGGRARAGPGKLVGIGGGTWLAVRTGLGRLPRGVGPAASRAGRRCPGSGSRSRCWWWASRSTTRGCGTRPRSGFSPRACSRRARRARVPAGSGAARRAQRGPAHTLAVPVDPDATTSGGPPTPP